MLNNAMSIAIIRTLYEFGVVIEHFDDTKSEPVIYISVPEFSYKKNINKKDVAGEYLSKKFKETMNGTGGPCEVKSRIRKGETWTEEMAKEAVNKFDQAYRYIRNEG